ncbi:MAG: MBL fold metallo-hydrolase [Atopobiaceae bacterium]|nr:MBL fold metallo-hydrolase [Atopobiaceae bacterium]
MAKDGIRQFVVGHLSTNCYALVSDGKCLVIDPGADGAWIANELNDVSVVGVVATHGHHDHVGGVRALCEATGAPFMVSVGDAERSQRALELSSHVFDVSEGNVQDAPAPNRELREGDVIDVGSLKLKVLETPGHTEGGIVLLGDGFAFMGDTLFAGSCGRTDLVGGNHNTLMQSLARLKSAIPPSTVLLCGHGPATTMATELATNPFLQ